MVSKRPTNQPTDRPADRQTDIATYRAAIAAKNIDDNLLKIQCSKCFDIFHKKCTDRKSSRGNWTSPPFICPRCTSSSPILAVNNYLDPAAAKSFESLSALPRLSGKQKRSTVNDTNPSIEFLNATIDTLKSALATNGLELKKLKESNEIKAKRIVGLETQLEEARKSLASHQCMKGTTNVHDVLADKETSNNIHDMKSALLENKVNDLQYGLTALSARFEALQMKLFIPDKESSKTVTFVWSFHVKLL